jgi:RNA polymerase sigma-70 factor (ECF subfamily)
MKELQEENLLQMLKDENLRTKAFSVVVQKYQEQIYWLIRKMALSHEDTNDVMQNTFLKAWSGLDSFRGDSQITTWLHRIAINETYTFLSSAQLRNSGNALDLEDAMVQNLRSDTYFSGDEVQLKLQRAILTLPPKQRLVFNMKYFEDRKYEEMEEILGTSVGALKASYHHAVKKIEEFLSTEN